MQIFIMRHGQAEHFADSDAMRALTETGKEHSRLMAKWLNTQLDSLELVLVSPYLRAQQTWESVAPNLPKAKKVLTEEGITPYGDSEQTATYLKALINIEQPKSLLLISHLPLVNYLTTEFDPSQQSLVFSTSAIAQLNYDLQSDKAELMTLQSP